MSSVFGECGLGDRGDGVMRSLYSGTKMDGVTL
jgi:hypothetical protein